MFALISIVAIIVLWCVALEVKRRKGWGRVITFNSAMLAIWSAVVECKTLSSMMQTMENVYAMGGLYVAALIDHSSLSIGCVNTLIRDIK